VLAQLRKLDVGKTTGPDGISAGFLKSVTEELANPFTYIFNLSLQSIPSVWKQSNITPVHKGGSCDDPGNFRPISVVPITAKLLEKLISFQLCSYLEDHGLLHGDQELTNVDVQQIKFYYLLRILSPVLLIRDLQFALHC